VNVATFRSPFGTGWLGVDRRAVVSLRLSGTPPGEAARTDSPLVRKIERYFAGERVAFGAAVRVRGASPFARRVYEAVRAIPYGETRTYGRIAELAGSSGAARAVGQLMRRNPVCLLIP